MENVSIFLTSPRMKIIHLLVNGTERENGDLVLMAATSEQIINNNQTASLSDETVVNATNEVEFSSNADLAIGAISIVLTIVAVAGNALSFLYFRRKVRVSLPLYLYAIISAIDLCEASLSFPVIDSLLNSRSAGLFDQTGFCLIWAMMFSYFRRMSMIMVMVVALTRAMATYNPFRNIRTRTVLFTLVCYAVLIFIIDVIYFSASWLKTKYRPNESFCELYPSSITIRAAFYAVILQLEFIVPCLIVVGSFITCTISITVGQSATVSRREKGKRRATITIAIFSSVFLLCNLPVFLVQLDYLLAQFTTISTVEDFSENKFLAWYAHIMSHFVFSLLNTALNPCLYLLRMPNYRQWLKDIWNEPDALFRQRSKSMITQRSSSILTTIDAFIPFRRSRGSSLMVRLSRSSIQRENQ